MEQFQQLTENCLPPERTLVWIKRKNGVIYLGHRLDNPILATNPDESKDCFWYGNPMNNATTLDANNRWRPHNNFSDVTVESWAHLVPPTV